MRKVYDGQCTPQSQLETTMAERPRLLDDLVGLAGGAVSAMVGLRDEAEAIVRARVEETLRGLDLVRREEFDAVAAMVAKARQAQECAEARVAALEVRIEELTRKPGGGGPGMMT